jgi:hypothetical protein
MDKGYPCPQYMHYFRGNLIKTGHLYLFPNQQCLEDGTHTGLFPSSALQIKVNMAKVDFPIPLPHTISVSILLMIYILFYIRSKSILKKILIK